MAICLVCIYLKYLGHGYIIQDSILLYFKLAIT